MKTFDEMRSEILSLLADNPHSQQGAGPFPGVVYFVEPGKPTRQATAEEVEALGLTADEEDWAGLTEPAKGQGA